VTLRQLKRTWILGVLILCLAIPLWGQLYTGSISGQVSDQSGAVILNANVTATDVERRYTYTTQTDNTGHFAIHEVPPAQYTLSVEAKGFKKYVHEAFKVDVGTAVTVNATLPVAAGTIEVVVTDTGAPLLQTEDATVGQTIDHKFVNDLPLIGRSVTDLVYLSPGINPAAGLAYGPPSLSGLDITQLRQTNFVSNGSRNGQSDMLVDGITATEPENNGGSSWAIFSPNVDSVQEFKVQQGNFSAEYGQTGSTIVNAVTRSGTNIFHGSAYEFLRNNITDAKNYFSSGPLPPSALAVPAICWARIMSRCRSSSGTEYPRSRLGLLGSSASCLGTPLSRPTTLARRGRTCTLEASLRWISCHRAERSSSLPIRPRLPRRCRTPWPVSPASPT
jgi:hypothetical protein